jgi:DNA-binding CsgD family transcriptional regulator
LPTIRTALAAFAERKDSINGLTLITELVPFWIHRGPIREAMTWLRTFLDIERTRGAPDSLLGDIGAGWVQRLRLESAGTSDVAELRRVSAAVAARRPSAGQWFHCTDHLVLALLREGQLGECTTVIDSGIGRALAVEDPHRDDSHWLSVFLFRRAQLRWTTARGIRVDEVVPYAEEALAVARSSGHRLIVAWAENLLGLCHVAERNWVSARSAMTAALGHFREIGDHSAAAASLQHLAAILTELGGTAEAARCLRDAIVATRRVGDATGEMQCTWAIAFVAVRSGRLLDATRMDDALAEYLGAVERGLPAVLLDDYETAMTQARSSLGIGPRASRGHGWGWLRTRALELAGTAATGLPVQGALSLTVSTTSAPAVGLVVSAVSTNGGPGSANGGPADDRDGDPAGRAESAVPGAKGSDRAGRGRSSAIRSALTARELEILAAIASGQTNAQIAKDLFLSAKTVMHHSTSIYRKLGVRGRAEAVALAYTSGLLQADGHP